MHRWHNKNISLTLDITTHCNAKCPQCARTDNLSGGLKRYSNIPLMHWSIAQIKAVFTKKTKSVYKRQTKHDAASLCAVANPNHSNFEAFKLLVCSVL